MNVTLDDLRNEYAADTVGPLLLDLLDRVVRATAPQYPAQEYSDASVWNREAFEDARNDWVERRLLGRGDLAKMLTQTTTVARLRAALTTSFRQFLVNRRPMSSAARLYKRSHDMLRAKRDFFPVGASSRSGEQLWTLASAPRDERARHELPALVGFARELSDDDLGVVRYADETLKSSPILRAPALERFLVHLLERAGGALDTATIAQVMRIRFELWELEPVELEDAFTADEPPTVATVPVDIAARSVFLRLTPELARRLIAVDDAGGDFELAARIADCPSSELIDAVSEAAAMIAAVAADGDEAHEIYARLKELLRGG